MRRPDLLALLCCAVLLAACKRDDGKDFPSYLTDCPGDTSELIDLRYDHEHCGACGQGCGKHNVCEEGECRASREVALWPIPEMPLTNDHYEIDDDTARDRITGLEWQRHVEGRVPWEMANQHCETLELAGGGWRLPTRIELQSIVDFTRRLPAINDDVFPIPDDDPPWGGKHESGPNAIYCPYTAEPHPNLVFKHRKFPADRGCEDTWFIGVDPPSGCDSVWSSIDLMEGTQRYYDYAAGEIRDCTPTEQFVRCVRGGPEPKAMERRYEVEDDTALDVYTGLRWQRVLPECSPWDTCEQPFYTLEQAQDYCEDLVVHGYDDFRVPSITELLSLIYPWQGSVECPSGEEPQWLDGDVFCDDLDDADLDFYSSTLYARSAELDGGVLPWIASVDFRSATYEIGARRVRCVRTED